MRLLGLGLVRRVRVVRTLQVPHSPNMPATATDQHPRQMPLILRSRATSSGCRFCSEGCCGGLRRNLRTTFRCTMMRSSNDDLDRVERDQDNRQKRSSDRSHAIRRFSALSLPRFATMSKDTLAPSASEVKPAFSTAEI
jgi:hypothetical protein